MIFIIIVTILQTIQSEYNPMVQQMSELALGKFGSFMFFAFLSLSISIFALSLGLRSHQAPAMIRSLLIAASIGIMGGGVFRLDIAPNTHIALVSLAFVLLVLVMCFLPQKRHCFNSAMSKAVSRVSAAGTAIFIALGQNILPLGVGQRGAALFILFWLIWAGNSLRSETVSYNS